MNEFTDQQERLSRLDGIERNVEWLKENWESAESFEIAKRLGLIQGDAKRLTELASETQTNRSDSGGDRDV